MLRVNVQPDVARMLSTTTSTSLLKLEPTLSTICTYKRGWRVVVKRFTVLISLINRRKLDGCIVWNAHNTVFGSKCSTICAQAVYFLHSTRTSVKRLNSWWWLAACNWVMSALSAVLSTHVGHRRQFGEVSCMECTGQWNDFKFIPTVEIKTRNPMEGYFGNKFTAICNQCRVMVAQSHKTLKKIEKLLHFLEKQSLIVKFSKFCSKRFHRNNDQHVVFKFREIWPMGNLWNRALLTWQKIKFYVALQLSLLCGSHPKSARASHQQINNVLKSTPDFIKIGSLSVEL